jgi:argininosuccinate lyase
LSGDLTEDVARLTSSSKHDHYIADDVIRINQAYVLQLARIGVLRTDEARLLSKALTELLGKIKSVPPEMEDVHMVIEDDVAKKVGPEVGGKLHTGKSRNDQVATAVRMRLRDFLLEILQEIADLRSVLLSKAASNIEVIIPGFTHLQHAQPVTAAHHLLAYFDMFGRDFDRLNASFARVNLSPMGAAALAGTGYPIDRLALAELLGFDGLLENTMDAVASRDFALEVVSDLTIMMANISRLAEEIVIWGSYEFNYIGLPDDHSSTSSIMPQKKNPVTAEILRSKCGDLLGEFTSMVAIMKALPLTYNLDMQEVTPHLWNSCEISSLSLRVLSDLIGKMEFNRPRLTEIVRKDFSVATELADLLVREGGLPFRRSHQIVGEIVRELAGSSSSLTEEPLDRLSEIVKEKSGRTIAMESIERAVDPTSNVNIRATRGGPSFEEAKRMIRERECSLRRAKDEVSSELAIQERRLEGLRSALLSL